MDFPIVDKKSEQQQQEPEETQEEEESRYAEMEEQPEEAKKVRDDEEEEADEEATTTTEEEADTEDKEEPEQEKPIEEEPEESMFDHLEFDKKCWKVINNTETNIEFKSRSFWKRPNEIEVAKLFLRMNEQGYRLMQVDALYNHIWFEKKPDKGE